MRLELHIPDGSIELARLRAMFPAMSFELVCTGAARTLPASAWRADDFDFWSFDRSLDEVAARGDSIRISARAFEAVTIAQQIATRAQRLAPRRNTASRTPWFDRVLLEHRGIHDLRKPLVRADYDHALDTWQWTLRRDPHASAALQLAALLHDIERLVTESDRRVEHEAADYQAFKDAHARSGAALAKTLLARAQVPSAILAATTALIAVHERTSADAVSQAINDADGLSFFSLNSFGYLRYFGEEQTAKKIEYTLTRMSPAACRELAMLRVPRVVGDLVKRAINTRVARRTPCAS
jgi:hypothetical protein